MSKHTPGPWIATGKYVRKMDRPGVWPDWNICEVNMNAAMDNSETGKANARLIAAAPDMLSALEAFVGAWKKSLQLEKTDVALRMAESAIAKARGES